LNISQVGPVFLIREDKAMEKNLLDTALAAWRESSQDETLSERSRTALFAEVRSMEGAEGVFVPSVTRAWRWAFLGSVPVVAITAVLVLTGDHLQPLGTNPQLTASKVHGQVVFTLANGKTEHLIYRSTDPQSFDRSSAVKMAKNRYTEDATGGPALVFYKID
jgi:hypothetical protein